MKQKLIFLFIYLNILFSSKNCKEINQTVLFNEYGYSFDSELIDLKSKSIDVIDLSTFKGLNKLEVLYLDDNSITSLVNGLFKDLVNLKEIWLEDNSLISINKNIFVGLNNLELVCFKNNPIATLYPTITQRLCDSNPKCNIKIFENCIRNIVTSKYIIFLLPNFILIISIYLI